MQRLMLIGGLLAAVMCPVLRAQTMTARATIPFEFRIGNRLMPAGPYWIHNEDGVLTVSATSGKRTSTFAFTNAAYDTNQAAEGELHFNRYGREYFLSSVGLGSGVTRTLRKASRERELARGGPGAVQTAGIALQSK